jgi:non-ribosomal peptide synthetase component E (peptide arylation enzyme)
MIKVVDTLYSKLPAQFSNVPASTTITTGALLYNDFTNKGLIPATNAAGTTTNIEGVSTQNVTVGGGATGTVKYIPLSEAVFCVVDTTANTSSAQLNINHAMTNSTTVNNTTTNVATVLGVFHALGTVGAATNNKLYGYFNKIGQVTI